VACTSLVRGSSERGSKCEGKPWLRGSTGRHALCDDGAPSPRSSPEAEGGQDRHVDQKEPRRDARPGAPLAALAIRGSATG
jgi:hypothetical protein